MCGACTQSHTVYALVIKIFFTNCQIFLLLLQLISSQQSANFFSFKIPQIEHWEVYIERRITVPAQMLLKVALVSALSPSA
jgi:hypothetical protein